MATAARCSTLTIQQSFTLHTQHHLLHLHWQWVRELYSCPGLGPQSQPTGSHYLQLWRLRSNGDLFREHLACSINHQEHSELEVDLVHREREFMTYNHTTTHPTLLPGYSLKMLPLIVMETVSVFPLFTFLATFILSTSFSTCSQRVLTHEHMAH